MLLANSALLSLIVIAGREGIPLEVSHTVLSRERVEVVNATSRVKISLVLRPGSMPVIADHDIRCGVVCYSCVGNMGVVRYSRKQCHIIHLR